jgi:hypothetical protein
MAIKKLNPEDLATPTVGGTVQRSEMNSSNTDNLTSEGDEEIADEELRDGEEGLEDDVDEESIDGDDVSNEEDENDESDEISVDDEETEDGNEDVEEKAFSKN